MVVGPDGTVLGKRKPDGSVVSADSIGVIGIYSGTIPGNNCSLWPSPSMPPPSPPPPAPPAPPAPPGSPPAPPALPLSDCFEREWVDVDTPPDACTTTSERDGRVLSLVFSDEFEAEGRTFADGQDSRWTAIDHAPNTNAQVNYYNSSLAHTAGGKLRLVSNSDDAVFDTFATDGTPGGPYETRHLQTAMLQGWNKFCFSQGIAEVSAR